VNSDNANLLILIGGLEKSLKKVRKFLAQDDKEGVKTYLADALFRLKALWELLTQQQERRDN